VGIAVLEKPEIRRMVAKMTLEQYEKATLAGAVAKNTELIEGVVIEKMSKSPKHANLVSRLSAFLQSRIPADYLVRAEQPITTRDSAPEPDIAVVRGTFDDFEEKHPQKAALIIEVSLSTLDLDREKADIYAQTGAPHYLLFNLRENVIEMYSDIRDEKYQRREIRQFTDTIELPGLQIAIDLPDLMARSR
jgi:Uma2 family endonuclease